MDEDIQQGEFFQTGGDNGILRQNDTKRNSDIIGLVVSFFSNGDVHDNQSIVIFDGYPGHFFRIEWRP